MILLLLFLFLILILYTNNNEHFLNENNLKIINEIPILKSKCFYNNNEMFIGKKYIQKMSDNNFYTTCEYNLDNKNQCSPPCLLIDQNCNTSNEPVTLQLDKNNNQKCRTQSKQI